MGLLENEHILLRALEPEDLDMIFQTENDTSIWQVSDTLTPFSRKLLADYIDNARLDIFEARQLRLAIAAKHSGDVMGLVDLFNFEPQHQRAGVGIVILAPFQNRGIGKQALSLFTTYAFKHLDLHQLYANIPSNNKRSIRLFENSGFEHIGSQKDWLKSNGSYLTVELFQRLNPNHS